MFSKKLFSDRNHFMSKETELSLRIGNMDPLHFTLFYSLNFIASNCVHDATSFKNLGKVHVTPSNYYFNDNLPPKLSKQ
jgi:hypothetical protein